jgi:hypothetical protein
MKNKTDIKKKEGLDISSDPAQITIDTGNKLAAFQSWQMGFVSQAIERDFRRNAEYLAEKSFRKHVESADLPDDENTK